MLITVWGVHEAALLVSRVTPEEVLHIVHVASILRGSPFSRSRSLIPTAMVPRVASPGAVGVEVMVTLLLKRQLQEKYRQVLVSESSSLAFSRSPTLIPHVSWDLGH